MGVYEPFDHKRVRISLLMKMPLMTHVVAGSRRDMLKNPGVLVNVRCVLLHYRDDVTMRSAVTPSLVGPDVLRRGNVWSLLPAFGAQMAFN